jgi:acid stress-induced BolA-like protein IbaG/YrbA
MGRDRANCVIKVEEKNSSPAVQGNTLRVKVVVSDVFREVLRLKGSKIIYANVAIDVPQNKYIRLEPL